MDGVNWANERKCFQGIFLSNHKLDGVMDGVNSTTLCDCTLFYRETSVSSLAVEWLIANLIVWHVFCFLARFLLKPL